MKTVIAFTIASMYGLLLRFFFAFYSNITEVLSISLVFLAPAAIGYLTVSLSGLEKVNSLWSAFFRPWITTFILLLLTIILALEGTICWIMIYPLFSIVAGLGGILAYQIMRGKEKREYNSDKPDILDDFDRKNTLKSSVLLLLPMLFGVIEQDRLFRPAEYSIACEVIIPASADRVWSTLTSVTPIQEKEEHSFFTAFLGLPRHLSTALDTLAIGGKRRAIYERGLYFEETISALEPGKSMTVSIKADPGNIPPTVLDEHIVIGGRHFKALEDRYELTELPDGTCRLELRGRIVINTPFNWYAGLWARWVLSDLFQNLLDIIKTRSSQQ